MSFDIYNKNKLIDMEQIDDYEKVTCCEDCTYFDDTYCFGADDGYCWWNDTNVKKSECCQMQKKG